MLWFALHIKLSSKTIFVQCKEFKKVKMSNENAQNFFNLKLCKNISYKSNRKIKKINAYIRSERSIKKSSTRSFRHVKTIYHTEDILWKEVKTWAGVLCTIWARKNKEKKRIENENLNIKWKRCELCRDEIHRELSEKKRAWI